MTEKMPEEIGIISSLLLELSTEIDMHYEDEDFFALEPSITPIRNAIKFLESHEAEVPTAARHVVARFNRARN